MMGVDAAKSDIKHATAKRFMVIFAVLTLIGIVFQSVHSSVLAATILVSGAVGFLGAALIASERGEESTEPGIREQLNSFGEGLFALIGRILTVIFFIVLGLGLLWGLIAIIKWMWIHS